VVQCPASSSRPLFGAADAMCREHFSSEYSGTRHPASASRPYALAMTEGSRWTVGIDYDLRQLTAAMGFQAGAFSLGRSPTGPPPTSGERFVHGHVISRGPSYWPD